MSRWLAFITCWIEQWTYSLNPGNHKEKENNSFNGQLTLVACRMPVVLTTSAPAISFYYNISCTEDFNFVPREITLLVCYLLCIIISGLQMLVVLTTFSTQVLYHHNPTVMTSKQSIILFSNVIHPVYPDLYTK